MLRSRPLRSAITRLVAGLCVGVAFAADTGGPEPSRLTHGVAAGEATATDVVVWGRCQRAGMLRVALDGRRAAAVPVAAEHDFTGKVKIGELRPSTWYRYSAWCDSDQSVAEHGAFRTAPAPNDPAPVRFAWGGDLAGQNVCRDRTQGFPIVDLISARRPDFFVALGDMIYADDACSGVGRYGNTQVPGIAAATTLDGFWADWRYTRDDPALQRLLAATTYYAVWDDHEVVDDFGPYHDTARQPLGGTAEHLLPRGMAAFLDYAPMMPSPPDRLYRNVRWGRHLELFILDTRQHRDSNLAEDVAEQPKTMLGTEQCAWLERELRHSDATWKVVVSSVPMSIPTGTIGRDGWADLGTHAGFERELAAILSSMWDAGLRNVLWITTDVHFAAVLRYRPIAADPAFVVHEIAVGPLNAGVFFRHQVDPTFRPEPLFLHGPAVPESVTSLESALGWFNFGLIEIGADGTLVAEIVDARGQLLYRLSLPARRT